MKVRTKEALFDLISEDLGWRRVELSVFHKQVLRADAAAQSALLRASVALLYAHWEGFVKNSCHWYYCYLASRKQTIQSLRPELAGVALRPQMQASTDSKKPHLHADLVRTIRERATERAKIPTTRDSVRTNSNLSFEVLQDVLTAVGCSADSLEPSRDLINEELVAVRNRIVHGENEFMRLSEWEDLRSEVLMLMEQVGDQIISACVDETFLAWKT